ncbi:MAG: fructosamine kinase family protein [Kiloniellales bacterium]|nr:fructosamine kinase family protein [Kiloniellales bacterium]
MTAALAAAVEAALGRRPLRFSPLTGGCIAEVYRADLDDGETVVVKTASRGDLMLEAFMLGYLAENTALPVPAVRHAAEELLIIDHVEAGDGIDAAAETHAAELLAALHGIAAPRYGFEQDTLIGPLAQPNPWTESWADFFAEQRLLHFGRIALEAGHLPAETLRLLERLCGRLPDLIGEAAQPSLIHGDVWGGNVLVRGDRIAAFVDPAIHYADAEVELAFSTLFGTFGEPFFRRYGELRPLRPGFFEARRDLYNLYPLLVHTALFGGHYARSVGRIADRFV